MKKSIRRARAAIFLLKEAVLDVLIDAQHEGPLQTEDIRERLGIPKTKELNTSSNTVIHGILLHLQTEGRVQHHTEHGWEITAIGNDEQQIQRG